MWLLGVLLEIFIVGVLLLFGFSWKVGLLGKGHAGEDAQCGRGLTLCCLSRVTVVLLVGGCM